MVETSSSNVDLVGTFAVLIGQRRSTETAKCPPRACLCLISAWRSFHELELRTFYYDPSDRLGSGGSAAVCTMTIRPDADFGRRTETHFATITAAGNFILFHPSHRKLGMLDRDRDDLCRGGLRKRAWDTAVGLIDWLDVTARELRRCYHYWMLRREIQTQQELNEDALNLGNQ
jgi:hypothetical protein